MLFLHGCFEEDVYMELALGFEEKFGRVKVCRLRKSFYGLKHSSYAWFEKFTKSLHCQGYLQSQIDHSMFHIHERGKVNILIVYVNDKIVIGNNLVEISNLKDSLAK